MEFKTVEEFVIEKKHVAAVAFGGLLLAGAVIFYVNSAVSAPPAVSKVQSAAPAKAPAVRPVPEKREAKEMRDPFAAPAEFRQESAVNGQAQAAAAGSVSGVAAPVAADANGLRAAKAALPVLQGIAASGGQRMAVLQVGGQSRSYRLLERAGPYEVIAIEKDSVTLSGPDGKTVLAMER
ncbi:MAG: hypothetical protein H6Q66_11 [Firmicutes bacterium]|nr:hypothetical protein [Bacillota bacterium]